MSPVKHRKVPMAGQDMERVKSFNLFVKSQGLLFVVDGSLHIPSVEEDECEAVERCGIVPRNLEGGWGESD
jgi:hypothetical protein